MRVRTAAIAIVIGVAAIAVGLIASTLSTDPSAPAGPPQAKAGDPAPKPPPKQAKVGAPARKPPPKRAKADRPAEGEKLADKKAAKAGKHVFLFFHKGDTGDTSAMRKIVESAAAKLGDKAEVKAIDVTAASVQTTLKKHQVDPARTPMPLVLVLAPNGAIVNSFAVSFKEKDLTESLAGPCLAACLKALQDRKLVFVCAQNAETKANAAAMKGVKDFKADKKYAKLTEIVTVDPKDKAEKRLLSQLQISPDIETAVTVLLAPPGKIAGRFVGATQKAKLAAAVAACGAACKGPG